MIGQGELFFETLPDALRATIDALGGPKAVGVQLWPEKTVDEARRLLLDCLNPDRPHRLDPETLLLLLRLAREKGVHLAVSWMMADLGYARPTPIDPEDQLAEHERQFIRAVEKAQGFASLIERSRTRLKAV